MKNINIKESTLININESYEGETIEEKIERITNNSEPIDNSTQMYYTDKKEGVMPEFDIRTDRWEVAQKAMDYVTKTNIAKREEKFKEIEKNNEITQKNDTNTVVS